MVSVDTTSGHSEFSQIRNPALANLDRLGDPNKPCYASSLSNNPHIVVSVGETVFIHTVFLLGANYYEDSYPFDPKELSPAEIRVGNNSMDPLKNPVCNSTVSGTGFYQCKAIGTQLIVRMFGL